ncbi:RNA-directed DNA polymerase, eukaryota, partial [Tanacetum coccineum]
FSNPGKSSAKIQLEFPNQITQDQCNNLESDVTNVEIKKAVWDCGTDKAPGPDGFTFGFFRHFWYLVDKEIYDAVRYFFENYHFPNGCNSSFIALIPKIPDANLVKDFRPISLIGSLYKIIAKILTNRLVGVLGSIVNEVQSAFIENRQILDGPFILNEVLSWCKKRNKQSLIFKVDFEKAYDSVRWDFLDDALSKFGFGVKWRKWIYCCLHSSRGSIIINGSPTEEFQFGRGLKQGDPLSPFLFILIMETLHISFQRVVDAGMFHGIKLGDSVNLSHMFYADDAVFVGEWSERNITTLVHTGKVARAAEKLGCLVFKTPFNYLGSLVGGDMHRLQVPAGILRTLESIRCHFFNGHDITSKKVSWVQWNKVLASKDNGGLGVSSLFALNRGDSTAFGRDLWVLMEGLKIDILELIPLKLANRLRFRAVSLTSTRDRWVWALNGSGDFSVSSIRNLIDSRVLPKGDLKTKWIRHVPIKAGVEIQIICSFKCDPAKTRFPGYFRDGGIFLDKKIRKALGWSGMGNFIRMPAKNKRMLEGVFLCTGGF